MGALVTADDLASALHMSVDSDPEGFAQVAAAADGIVAGLLVGDADHSRHPADREAALQVGVEMYQARNAAGGQGMSVEFAPSVYRLSVWLTRRVASLTAPCASMRGWIG